MSSHTIRPNRYGGSSHRWRIRGFNASPAHTPENTTGQYLPQQPGPSMCVFEHKADESTLESIDSHIPPSSQDLASRTPRSFTRQPPYPPQEPQASGSQHRAPRQPPLSITSLPVPQAPRPPPPRSHGKQRAEGYIPRPPNAFILFRRNFANSKRVPDVLEQDPKNISVIAGTVWNNMSRADRKRWVDLALLVRPIFFPISLRSGFLRRGADGFCFVLCGIGSGEA